MTDDAGRPRWALWRSPSDQPRWARPGLLGVAAVAAVSYVWGIAGQEPEIYYAAAVRSMSASWHDFLFAAFDPAGTISIDKLPGALWLQALSVRVFGVHLWALNLPQAIEGVLTVLVLYRAVRRLSGPLAGLVSAAVLATSPATVALNRGNVSDSLLVLLLVCAADATAAAIGTGRARWLAVAGVWVGLAFQAKMLQAWLVVPALLCAWLLGSGASWGRRVATSIGMIGITALVSLSWMLAISAVPHADRPYVDGSSHDSIFAQVFEYNGLSRADATPPSVAAPAPSAEPGPVTSPSAGSGTPEPSAGSGGAQPAAAALPVTLNPKARADRVVTGRGGRAIGWLLPLALAGLLVGMRRRAARPAAVLWGLWLVADTAAFLGVDLIHAYYLAALSPAVAALTGSLVAAAARPWALAAIRRRAGAVIVGVATAAYGTWLASPAPLAVQIAAAVAAAGCCVAAVVVPRRTVAALLAAVVITPAVACVALVVVQAGPFVTPYESVTLRSVTQEGVGRVDQAVARDLPAITTANAGARYPAAMYPALLAAPFIFVSGQEFLPIGGFSGRTPSPTLDQLASYIRSGELRTVFGAPTSDPRMLFVRSTCQPIQSATTTRVVGYFCRAG